MSLMVIVPAHNEEAQIASTIESLISQTCPADRIVVVSDNSTDRTVEIAKTYPVTVMETNGNTHRKAGAMNQAWHRFGHDYDYIITMDADTILHPEFFERCIGAMYKNADLAGASACPMLKPYAEGTSLWGRMIWRLARLDFGGYMRILCAWDFSPEVLSGYGTIFRNDALKHIASERADGNPWATESIVEDYRISMDLRRLGYQIAIVPRALAFTDTPLTIRELWTQRIRWAGGTWEELGRSGYKPYTKRAWRNALGCVGSALMRVLAISVWITAAVLGIGFHWAWIWTIPLLIAVIDRLDMTRYTVDSDWKDALLIIVFLPMEFFSILRELWTVKSAWLTIRRKQLSW